MKSTFSVYEHDYVFGRSSPAFLPAVVAGDVLSEEHETPWPLRRQRAGPPLEALNPDHSDLLLLKCVPASDLGGHTSRSCLVRVPRFSLVLLLRQRYGPPHIFNSQCVLDYG